MRRQIMVASDAMTRGMDVPGVTVVINYDTPVYAKTYVHRAGDALDDAGVVPHSFS